jgi:hypothetical protein
MSILSINRSSLSQGDLDITADGSGRYELVSFTPGRVDRDNVYAESRWLDGAQMVSSRKRLATMNLVVRVHGDDAEDALDGADELTAALADQLRYTITEETGTALREYACLSATVDTGRDPVLLEAGIVVVTAIIPRQP